MFKTCQTYHCLNIAVLITHARHNQTLKACNFLKLYKQTNLVGKHMKFSFR